jgi:DNA-binding transcriptional LysR family regulator
MTDPLETAEIAAFARAVEARSLSRAAAELGVPRATLSRRLARLERRLGVRLLRRTTRSLTLTDAGESFYRHSRSVLEAVRTAEESVRRVDDAVRGTLRVSVPPLLPPSFRELVCDFMARYPEVKLSVHAQSRHVDLQRDGYDVALRATSALEPGLIARRLAREPVLCVAAPTYLTTHGAPRTRRELTKHRCLMGFSRGELPESDWRFASGAALHVDGIFHSNEIALLRTAAVRGLGIAYLPLTAVFADLERGALVPVLPKLLRGEAVIALVHLEREFVPPVLRAFIDAVVEWAPSELGRAVPELCRSALMAQAAPTRSRRRARATG